MQRLLEKFRRGKSKQEIAPEHATQGSQDAHKGHVIAKNANNKYSRLKDESPSNAGARRTASGPTRGANNARHGATDSSAVIKTATQSQKPGRSLASQPSYDYNDLREKVAAELNKHHLGLDQKYNYIPDTRIQALVNEEEIALVFPRATEEFISFIVENVPKTFLTTVLVFSDPNDAFQAMQAFKKHNFKDSHCLPVPKLTAGDKAGHRCSWRGSKSETHTNATTSQFSPSCEHIPELEAFHHGCWGISDFDTFFEKQWSFLVQVFDHEKFKYDDIEDKRILPFLQKVVEDDVGSARGNFGDVVQAIMLADCLVGSAYENADPVEKQSVQEEHGQRTKTVAIKTLRPKDVEEYEEYSLEKEWSREAEAYQELNDLNHPNIVKGLAAYRHHGEFNLLLEWADGKSLEEFWKLHEKPELTRDLVRALLNQLYGLTDALHAMHNKERAPSRHGSVRTFRSKVSYDTMSKPDSLIVPVQPTPVVAFDPPTPEMNSSFAAMGIPKLELNQGETIEIDKDLANASSNAQGTTLSKIETMSTGSEPDPRSDLRRSNTGFVNWRHGDIKPANILRFNDGTWFGTLKLADLGRAKRHNERTSYRPDIENDRYHTKQYQPPDLLLYATTSRLYDIWSLGCVFFEAIVWLLYGLPEVWKLKQRTGQLEKKGTPFWTKKGLANATVSHLAQLWMKTMMEEDPDCGPDTALGDLMRLVRDCMLVVKLPFSSEEPSKGDRTNAEGVLRALTSICEKANSNDSYVVTGADRSNIKPPPSGKPSSGATFLNVPNVSSSDNTEDPSNQYSHSLNDDWVFAKDEDFVKDTILQVMPNTTSSSSIPIARLCNFCTDFDPCSMNTFKARTRAEIRTTSRQCDLCAMLIRLIGKKLGPKDQVSLIRKGGWLQVEGKGNLVLRICQTRDSLSGTQIYGTYIPIGLPRLPEAADAQHIGLLRRWITDCNQHGCIPQNTQVYCPRRLLFVGNGNNDLSLNLVETDSWTEKRKKVAFIALSHPWGDPHDHDHFKSTKKNVSQFCDAIEYSKLPQNFQDAITIARGVGVAYLWIDSICILQASDGDPGDFAAEKDRMQDIFNSAYCVIAACSAKGMSDGFLGTRDERKVLRLSQKDATRPQFFISELIDDFKHDVEYSPLNERGWVLQEHALARRTIYFTENQTYWECSNGIRCETLTKLRSDRASFLGDSDFPSKSQVMPKDHNEGQTMGAQIFQFTNLYEQYSRRKFKYYSDKPIAISGLEQRLTKIFGDRSGAGIFENHRERWLLWKRADGVDALEKISFAQQDDNTQIPPSWSWMSYKGGITFLRPPDGRVTWDREVELKLTGTAKTSWLSNPQRLSMRARVVTLKNSAAAEISQAITDLNLPADGTSKNISIIHDTPCDPENRVKHYVILGTFVGVNEATTRNYVLAVQPTKTKLAYKRIGTGWLPYSLMKANTETSNIFSIV